jgi:hypothetical protein
MYRDATQSPIGVGHFACRVATHHRSIAVTIDPGVHRSIIAAAARDGVSVWLTNAGREALQRRAGLTAVARWEKQHGRLTAEEVNEARRRVQAQLRTSRTARRPA